ncbi:unnamed protein product [Moneuplotes crassus]|uniref:Uncharacterized protein n=1 Tax=Euplotes crassus TaxID=5936 RepID=A0AAD1Y686_EUPCR|nr:unnamed protein product [Moneuplotes crassus]
MNTRVRTKIRIIKFEEGERKLFQKYLTVLSRATNRKASKLQSRDTNRFISPRVTANKPRLFSDSRESDDDSNSRDSVLSAVRVRKDIAKANSFILKKAPMCVKHKKEDLVSLPDANERNRGLRPLSPIRALSNHLSPRNQEACDRLNIERNGQEIRRVNRNVMHCGIQGRKVSEGIQRQKSPFMRQIDEITLKVSDAKNNRRGCNSPFALNATLGRILSMKKKSKISTFSECLASSRVGSPRRFQLVRQKFINGKFLSNKMDSSQLESLL